MKQKYTSIAALWIPFVVCAAPLCGHANPEQAAADSILTTPAAGSWEFRIEPYAWLTGMDGTIGVGPFASDLSPSFSDIIDYIDMAAALQFEARNGNWGIIADGFYADLGMSGSPPGPVYSNMDVEVQQFIGELLLAYRVYESPSGFVDLFAGFRYNNLSTGFTATPDLAGIAGIGDRVATGIFDGLEKRVDSIISGKEADYQTASAARRGKIEADVRARIVAEAEKQVKIDLIEQLRERRQDDSRSLRDLERRRISVAVKKERLALARATAELEVAHLKASVDARRSGAVTKARSRVDQAQQALADAVSGQIAARVPTGGSADQDWVDPVLGVRGQWNFHEDWFLAASGDIGGFGVGSDLAWSVQGTVGYEFNENVSAELGYRVYDTDYQNGEFRYDIAEHGVFTGLNIRF